MTHPKQARMALATYNNPKVDPQEYLEVWSKVDGVVFVTGQLEKGHSGTPHIQYFVQTKCQKRLGFFTDHCRHSHFELVKHDNGCEPYVNKEDTRIDGPWTFGIRPAKRNQKGDVARMNKEILAGKLTDAVDEGYVKIHQFANLVKSTNLYHLHKLQPYQADDVRGVWIYGKPKVGKSHYARENYPNAFEKAQDKWWCGYEGQENVILDDHDNPCLAHYLKIWADKWACRAETKGCRIPLVHKKFVVTSNFTIEELYSNEKPDTIDAIKRRFEIIHLPKLDGVL